MIELAGPAALVAALGCVVLLLRWMAPTPRPSTPRGAFSPLLGVRLGMLKRAGLPYMWLGTHTHPHARPRVDPHTPTVRAELSGRRRRRLAIRGTTCRVGPAAVSARCVVEPALDGPSPRAPGHNF